MLSLFVVRNVFCPEVTLYTFYELAFVIRQLVERIETVALLKRSVSADGERLLVLYRVGSLEVIQIVIVLRRHNDVVT